MEIAKNFAMEHETKHRKSKEYADSKKSFIQERYLVLKLLLINLRKNIISVFYIQLNFPNLAEMNSVYVEAVKNIKIVADRLKLLMNSDSILVP